jgi:hypothetical protein
VTRVVLNCSPTTQYHLVLYMHNQTLIHLLHASTSPVAAAASYLSTPTVEHASAATPGPVRLEAPPPPRQSPLILVDVLRRPSAQPTPFFFPVLTCPPRLHSYSRCGPLPCRSAASTRQFVVGFVSAYCTCWCAVCCCSSKPIHEHRFFYVILLDSA